MPGEYFGDVKFTGGHEQTIVAVYNGDIDAGVTWADGLGEWEDGYNSGALRKASDAGLVDMTELREIWRSPVIPEGPIVLSKKLPEDVKIKMTALMASLNSLDPECAYGVAAGETKGFMPILTTLMSRSWKPARRRTRTKRSSWIGTRAGHRPAFFMPAADAGQFKELPVMAVAAIEQEILAMRSRRQLYSLIGLLSLLRLSSRDTPNPTR
jgi:hypothetical protein